MAFEVMLKGTHVSANALLPNFIPFLLAFTKQSGLLSAPSWDFPSPYVLSFCPLAYAATSLDFPRPPFPVLAVGSLDCLAAAFSDLG